MKKNLLKYFAIITSVFFFIVIYLSTIGLETRKFNRQIEDKISETNRNLKVELKKIRLTLDPLNFKINAKTIDAKIMYRGKLLELEYIKAHISLTSLIKDQLVASNIKVSTKSILLKDLVAFIRSINNRPELFFLERFIKSGYLIADLEFNLNKYGIIKKDYKINGLLKDGKINLTKDNNFKKVNFFFDITKNNFNFKDISFSTSNIGFLSEELNITKGKKNYFFEGTIKNYNSNLNKKLLKILKSNYTKLNLKNINFNSINDFSFKVNNNLKVEHLLINSNIQINSSQYVKTDFINKDLIDVNDLIDLKNHDIKVNYSKENLSIKGTGKIKFKDKFEEIDYLITNKGSEFNLESNIKLSQLNVKNQKLIKEYLPKTNDIISLKDHKIYLSYKNNNLSLKGSGKIQLEKEFNKINYVFSKKDNKYNFDTKLDLNETSLKVDFINYKNNKKLNTKLKILGDYTKRDGFYFKEINLLEQDNKVLINNLLISKKNKIIKVDKVDMSYIDISNKKNKFILNRIKKNDYELNGSLFNANSLISDLLKSKDDKESKIFKNDINLTLNLSGVYIDNENMIKNLNGNLKIKNNKVVQTNISALFEINEKLTFSINTKDGEKITTLFSSRAKPLVKRYKFIKGYEEGYLDFYSSKKEKISKSTLKIYDFKLQEISALTKLLTLASLQGIADLVSGEGIRFNEFEMNFTNENNLMTIDEIYAIGPAISILMEGYVETDKLISLKGTMVPATTLNKVIGSIPLLGKILVGSKTGEGVFGVSFKIKGPPKNLKTTVNPIKTLTPRFITRTLERIKNN